MECDTFPLRIQSSFLMINRNWNINSRLQIDANENTNNLELYTNDIAISNSKLVDETICKSRIEMICVGELVLYPGICMMRLYLLE